MNERFKTKIYIIFINECNAIPFYTFSPQVNNKKQTNKKQNINSKSKIYQRETETDRQTESAKNQNTAFLKTIQLFHGFGVRFLP